MSSLLVLAAALLSVIFIAWLSPSAVDAGSRLVARAGSALHIRLHMTSRGDQESWVTALLIGLSRLPTIVLAVLGYSAAVAALVLPRELQPLVGPVSAAAYAVFLIRGASVFAAALILGPKVEDAFKSLKS